MRQLITAVTSICLLCLTASASIIVIDFETVPVIPAGPSTFGPAGPMQTITVTNVATVTGGVVLGNEAGLPAQSFATAPNVYATIGSGNPTLQSTLTIAVSSLFQATEVSFPLFNGATSVESYVATAFNGLTPVATQTLSSLPPNSNSGFGIIDLTAAQITSVTVAPSALDAGCCGGWDFTIDTIALNEPVQATAAPEPGNFLPCLVALAFGLAGLVQQRRRAV